MEDALEQISITIGQTDLDQLFSIDESYESILQSCGDLCNLNKPIIPGPYIGSVTSEVSSLITYTLKLD